jgi:hypothetical protein
MGRTGKDAGLFVGNDIHGVLTTHGGFVELLVGLNDKVDVGQKVAIQRNAFGEVVAEYTCGVAGEVAALRTDATAEPGTPLVFVIFNNPRPDEADPLSRVKFSGTWPVSGRASGAPLKSPFMALLGSTACVCSPGLSRRL